MCDALGIINFEDACVDITGLMDYRPASAISFLGRYRLIDFMLSNSGYGQGHRRFQYDQFRDFPD